MYSTRKARARTWSNLSNLSFDLDDNNALINDDNNALIDDDKSVNNNDNSDWNESSESNFNEAIPITKRPRTYKTSNNKKRKAKKHDNGKGHKKSGKWSTGEEKEANDIISNFENGTLEDCNDGVTLRSYLAIKLNCAPMRISKKFAGKCIGKLIYKNKKTINYSKTETNNKYNEETQKGDVSNKAAIKWTVKNKRSNSEKSDATSNESGHGSSDDDKSVNQLVPQTSSKKSSFFLSILPKIPSINFITSASPLLSGITSMTKEKNDENDNFDYYIDYLDTDNVGDIYYDSINQKPSYSESRSNSITEDIYVNPPRPPSSTGGREDDWLESLNEFCKDSMENLSGFFIKG